MGNMKRANAAEKDLLGYRLSVRHKVHDQGSNTRLESSTFSGEALILEFHIFGLLHSAFASGRQMVRGVACPQLN